MNRSTHGYARVYPFFIWPVTSQTMTFLDEPHSGLLNLLLVACALRQRPEQFEGLGSKKPWCCAAFTVGSLRQRFCSCCIRERAHASIITSSSEVRKRSLRQSNQSIFRRNPLSRPKLYLFPRRLKNQ